MSIIQLMPSSPLENGPFREVQIRIEKALRIAADLKEGGSRRRQRREELEAVEAMSTQRPDPASAPMKEEVFIDACGWNEARFRFRYVSPDRETIEEDLVLFFRIAAGGGVEWLTVNGGLPLFPVALFDAKLVSRKHAVPAPHRKREIRMIPRIDGRGAYLGVFSVMVDVP